MSIDSDSYGTIVLKDFKGTYLYKELELYLN